MSGPATLQELQARVEELEAAQVRRGKLVEHYRERLLEASAKYANMKVFCTEDSANGSVIYNPRDAEDMAKYLLQKMGDVSVQLLREMAKEEK